MSQELKSLNISESESEDMDIDSEVSEEEESEEEEEQETIPANLENSKLKLKVGNRVMIRWNDSEGFANSIDPFDWAPALVVSRSPQLEFAFFLNENELDSEEYIKGDLVTHIDLYDGNKKNWNPQKYYDFFENLTNKEKKDQLIKNLKLDISFMINYKKRYI